MIRLALPDLIAEVAASGVQFDDPRMDYVVIQVPRTIWCAVLAADAVIKAGLVEPSIGGTD